MGWKFVKLTWNESARKTAVSASSEIWELRATCSFRRLAVVVCHRVVVYLRSRSGFLWSWRTQQASGCRRYVSDHLLTPAEIRGASLRRHRLEITTPLSLREITHALRPFIGHASARQIQELWWVIYVNSFNSLTIVIYDISPLDCDKSSNLRWSRIPKRVD